ncbi:MAG: 16S rRNA (guanine(527)-N(7))-methyltransferase RsmG [Synergistaceae bacterium]|nr:16S rRNA (guanine(527)-N(7))-methyltransferase RsmG [Synergistaceae bacterium]
MEKEIFVKILESEVTDNEERLRKYVSLLSAANELARLTGPSDEETLWGSHVMDCASALPFLPNDGRVIDVGTGGGLPGMVWAICRPGLRLTLLDSITRKCALVEKIAVAMGLKNVTVVCKRSEEYAKEEHEKFHVAAARAVCASGILAEYLAPFVRIKGKAIAFKGPKVTEELELVGNKWKALGFSSPHLHPYTLGDMKRYFLIWDKIFQTPKGIPRRTGMAEKFPWYQK